MALRAALGQSGCLQRPARRSRPVHDHPRRPVARVGRLLRERQPDLAQPVGRRHQDRMQGSARHARRPAPGGPAAPDRGDRRHRPGQRDPRPPGRLRPRHHGRPQTAGRHLDRPQRRHLVPLVGRGQGPARGRSTADAGRARGREQARSRARALRSRILGRAARSGGELGGDRGGVVGGRPRLRWAHRLRRRPAFLRGAARADLGQRRHGGGRDHVAARAAGGRAETTTTATPGSGTSATRASPSPRTARTRCSPARCGSSPSGCSTTGPS